MIFPIKTYDTVQASVAEPSTVVPSNCPFRNRSSTSLMQRYRLLSYFCSWTASLILQYPFRPRYLSLFYLNGRRVACAPRCSQTCQQQFWHYNAVWWRTRCVFIALPFYSKHNYWFCVSEILKDETTALMIDAANVRPFFAFDHYFEISFIIL